MFTPYTKVTTITPSDTVNLRVPGVNVPSDRCADGIYVGTGGVVAILLQDDTVVNITAVAGTFLWIYTKRVNATNTTASNLAACWRI